MTTLDTLLLLALPASGKSEIRRYLGSADRSATGALHLGPLVDLDDYPYVHLMRRISEELSNLGADPIFFAAADQPFLDPRDWLTLIELLNEDYRAATGTAIGAAPDRSAAAFLDRMASARRRAGAGSGLDTMDPAIRGALAPAIAEDVAALPTIAPRPGGGTIVIEFARGGPVDTAPPLRPPLGYAHSLAALDPSILRVASILYVAVDPEDSRRRNRERSRPGRAGDASILHHGVPEAVMRHDYGCDDIEWMMTQAEVPGTVTIRHPSGTSFHVPTAVFDNREDLTSFLREDAATWPLPALDRLRTALRAALDRLVEPRTDP